MRLPSFTVVEDTDAVLCIRDDGPWDVYPTVTNAVEEVVFVLARILKGRRLEYIDSEGGRGEILVRNEEFAGFKPIGGVIR